MLDESLLLRRGDAIAHVVDARPHERLLKLTETETFQN